MDRELHIMLAEQDADADRIDALTRHLRQEVLRLDVESVTAISTDAPPPGARALDAAAVEGLLVALGTAGQGLAAVVTLMREWRKRGGEAPRKVRIEIDGDELVLSGETKADEERLVRLFIDRHSRAKHGKHGELSP